MSIAILAEKPSVARDIARVVGAKQRGEGCLRGNGYVVTFGDTRVYIAGDTENTPEMKALEDIDYACL